MKKNIVFSLGIILLALSCVKQPSSETPVVDDTPFFDFATTGNYNLNIDYKLTYNAPVVFYIYDEYPYTSSPNDPNNLVLKTSLSPVLKGLSENYGKYSGVINLKKTVSQIYIYSTTIGVPQLLKSTFSNNTFTIDAENSGSFITVGTIAKSSEFQSSNVSIPGFLTLGDWNSSGVPFYLLASNASVSAGLINDINASLPDQSRVPISSPHFISQGVNSALNIIENAVVELVFIHEGAGYKNVLGYFHYPTNSPPTSISQINKIIAFPNTSYLGSGGGLRTGNKVQLKYWNGSSFSNVFPAGTSIGWFIISDGYISSSSINSNSAVYYSLSQFNPESSAALKPHNVLLYDKARSLVLIGFEDMNRTASDDDFNDAIFYATSTPETAINYTNLPTIVTTKDSDNDGVPDDRDESPNDATYSYTTHYPSLSGYNTLAFEDLWPNRGDYDMNDVVISYNSTHYLNSNNKVVKILDKIKPIWAGGVLGCGYGYQFGISQSLISSVKKSSSYTDNNFIYTIAPNGTEVGQSKATIMVFDNINDLKTDKPQFDITINLSTPTAANQISTPPYNPFIVINKNNSRGLEVHLPNYAPTDLADKSLLGTANDKSLPSVGRYYISDFKMPFGILIPGVFDYPTESVSIIDYYPRFLEWSKSLGTKYPDWYLYKK